MEKYKDVSDVTLFRRLEEIDGELQDFHISAFRSDIISKERDEIRTELKLRGYLKEKSTTPKTETAINPKNWEGCTICSIKPAQKDVWEDYVSHRENDPIRLVTNKFNVIAVEDWNKWYGLYYLTKSENNEENLIMFTYGDIIDGGDHYYYPNTIVEFALKNNLKIDAVSYIAICKMYIDDVLGPNDIIPNRVLPGLDDLAKVIVENPDSYHSSFCISGNYDVSNWKRYVKRQNSKE